MDKSAAEVAQLQHERSVRLDQGQVVVEDVVPVEGDAVAVYGHWPYRVGLDAPDLGHREHTDGVQKWRRRSQRGDQAALVTLSGLVAAGGTVHYHGDFDWRGLAIAEVLVRKVPTAQPWRFGARDYAGAVQRGFGTIALSGLPHPSPWDPDLALVMGETGKAIYEEQVLEDLLEDMSKIASGGALLTP